MKVVVYSLYIVEVAVAVIVYSCLMVITCIFHKGRVAFRTIRPTILPQQRQICDERCSAGIQHIASLEEHLLEVHRGGDNFVIVGVVSFTHLQKRRARGRIGKKVLLGWVTGSYQDRI